MIAPATTDALLVAVALLAGIAVPWLVMRALVPTLEAAHGAAVTNYRGNRVVGGLGLVWVAWTLSVLVFGSALQILSEQMWTSWPKEPYSVWLDPNLLPLLLVLGAFSLGLADDVFGTSEHKGFRGHLRALASGRLSTGGLKLIGIGVLALVTAMTLADSANLSDSLLAITGAVVLQALAIALTANLVNLTDLRPGRALKVYSALVVGLLAVWGVRFVGTGGSLSEVVTAAAVFLGPVLAVWRFDLGERAMLGDAGANAAGALAGWLACVVLGTWWPILVYVAILLALNLASEKFSFSAVIEKNTALSWLDGLGRLPTGPSVSDEAEKSSTEVVAPPK